jgi:F-type H+-transporting ATPase subunit gamma
MPRLADIQARIASIGELLNIVGAMRSLAGMRVQEAQRALPSIRGYAEAMRAAIQTALLLMAQQASRPKAPGRRVLILCMAEHGFVSGFNERLMEAAEAGRRSRDVLFVLGSRGASVLFERGRKADWSAPMATRVVAAPGAAERLAKELYVRIARGEVSAVEVMYSHCRQGTQPTIERRVLLPLDEASLAAPGPRPAPLHNLEPEVLFERLAAEYVFALLTEAVVESIASENAARFVAMEAACDNVTKKLDELQAQARQARQNEITTELLDLITGAEASESNRGR